MDSRNSGSIQSDGEDSFFDRHHDLMWPRSGTLGRSDPNFSYFGTLIPTVPALEGLAATQPNPTAAVIQATQSTSGGAPSLQPPKNPRKRTRASRRAPTTVLTTDVSNFRQMVQEFTGIPAPPFPTAAASSSSSPYSRRFDLFSTALQYPPAAAAAAGFKLNPSPFPSPAPAPTVLNQAAIGSSNPDAGTMNNIMGGNYGGDHQLVMNLNDLDTAARNDGDGCGYGRPWWRNAERSPNPAGVAEIQDGGRDGDDGRGRGREDQRSLNNRHGNC